MARGTCYTPTMTASFAIDGNNDGITGLVRAELSSSCGLDDYECALAYLQQYPAIGELQQAYYNPSFPEEIAISVIPSNTGLGVAITFAILCVAFVVTAYLIMLLRRCYAHKHSFFGTIELIEY